MPRPTECCRALTGAVRCDAQLYYPDYLGLNPILTMVRLLPMFVTGVMCNVVVALVVGHVPVVLLISTFRSIRIGQSPLTSTMHLSRFQSSARSGPDSPVCSSP